MPRTVSPGQLEQELLDRLALADWELAYRRVRRTGGPQRARRAPRARRLGLFALAMSVLGIFAVAGVFAVHDEGFQLEGNATAADLHHGTVCVDVDNDKQTPCVNVAAGDLIGAFAGPYDWDSLFDIQAGAAPGNALGTVSGPKATLPAGFTGADFQKDFGNNGTTFLTGDDTTFATGSKDTLDINPNPGGWQCNHDNNVNSKVDIINGFAATAEINGNQLFYFGLEKDVDNGDNNVGMWLFQDPTVGCSSASGTANFTGHHTVGDLLVVSAFTNGGGVSNITVYQWNPGNATADDPLEKLASGADCLVTTGLDSVCATVFEPDVAKGTNTLAMPWLSADNSVVNAPHPSPNFYEGGINLSAFPQFADRCFTSYLLDTRSSQSPTANLFDYVQGSIGTCEPAMTITKVANPTDVCAGANSSVTYTYTITNTGNVDLTNVDVSDDTIPGAQAAFELANGGSDDIAEGAPPVAFTLDATVNATTTNIVTVDADSIAGENTASATATATVTAHDCTITVTKINSGDVCDGGSVTYTYTVTNNSDEFTWTGTLTDDKLGAIDGTIVLAPGASTGPLTASTTITGTVTNKATATGTFDDADSTSASGDASSTVSSHDCSITVTKINSGDVCDGGTVTYTITVTNNSDLFDWTGDVTDDVLGTLATGVTIAAGDSVTYTPSHAVTGTVTNKATATGTFDDADSTSASGDASSTVSSHDCSISVTKINSGDVCDGGTVTYTITVTNNSDLFDWTGDVTDDVLGTLATGVTIAAGDSVTYTPSHAVTGTVTNTVTASGTFNDADGSSASDSASSTASSHDCSISVTKINSGDVCDGGTVTYTITVTNNSDLFDWTGDVTDDVLGTLATGVTIAAGDSVTYTPSHAVTGTVTNTVTASGTFNDADGSSGTDSASSTASSHDCSISVTKINSGDVCDGGTVTYTITVTNNSDLFDWTGDVTDDVLGTLATGVTIAAGDSVTYTPSHAVTGTVTNTVTASGTFNDADGSSGTDSASSTASSHNCSISVTKTPSKTAVCNGDTVDYAYTVTNNSDAFDWTGDVVDDNGTPGDTSDDVTLASNVTIAAGDTKNYSRLGVVINGTVTNIVTADGAFNDPDATAASDTATATVVGTPCGGGCTPGFWQGGFGAKLWNVVNDPDWVANGGAGTNPFIQSDLFKSFFLPTGNTTVDNMTMLQIVGSGGTNVWARKAARDLIAAYLNSSFGSLNYPFSTATILADWATAVAGGNAGFQAFHDKYSVANQLGCTIGQPAPAAVTGSAGGSSLGLLVAMLPFMGLMLAMPGWRRSRRSKA